MKNLAGIPAEDANEQCAQELVLAGITATDLKFEMRGEVKATVFGSVEGTGWIFKRAWYYWIATGPGIPPQIAEEFHATWGKTVRVEGHCGCPSPLEYNKGFAVGNYHIDEQAGLKAFADLLKSILESPNGKFTVTKRKKGK